jgi:hypothetical protein
MTDPGRELKPFERRWRPGEKPRRKDHRCIFSGKWLIRFICLLNAALQQLRRGCNNLREDPA